MQELLTVNERYHELLHISEEQRRELESAREELGRLRPALAEAEEQLTEARAALDNAQSTCASLQAANELHAAKHEAMRAEISDLHNVLQKYAQRLLASEAELAATKQRNLEAEALLAAHWEAGYEEGKAQLETEARARLRRAQERAKQKAEEAFEHGKRVHANEVMSHRQRDEAERRVLLRRADEAKEREEKVQMVLESERQAREEAAERAHKLEERLQSVRTHKAALASELEATRAAHSADLDHFEQMENALGRACTEYSSLAVRHARLLSPPRSGKPVISRNRAPRSKPSLKNSPTIRWQAAPFWEWDRTKTRSATLMVPWPPTNRLSPNILKATRRHSRPTPRRKFCFAVSNATRPAEALTWLCPNSPNLRRPAWPRLNSDGLELPRRPARRSLNQPQRLLQSSKSILLSRGWGRDGPAP
jgi:hypothetical protein